MDKIIKNFAIGLVALIILAPLGLLAVGETFGEWGPEEVKEKLGFVPPGLEQLSSLWEHPCRIMLCQGPAIRWHPPRLLTSSPQCSAFSSAVVCFTSWARGSPKTDASF
jgi:hypothetical protein